MWGASEETQAKKSTDRTGTERSGRSSKKPLRFITDTKQKYTGRSSKTNIKIYKETGQFPLHVIPHVMQIPEIFDQAKKGVKGRRPVVGKKPTLQTTPDRRGSNNSKGKSPRAGGRSPGGRSPGGRPPSNRSYSSRPPSNRSQGGKSPKPIPNVSSFE